VILPVRTCEQLAEICVAEIDERVSFDANGAGRALKASGGELHAVFLFVWADVADERVVLGA
jgi:hypothetical protein